jgi:hypothetical protein
MRARRVAVIALCAACHHGGSNAPDASTDATPDALPTGPVDVTVYTGTGGILDPTAIAIFIDPSGATIQHGKVDANGHAHAEVPAGSTLTVLQAHDDPTSMYRRYEQLTTIRSIAPGDQLVVGKAPPDPNYRAGTTDGMTATYTALDPMSGPYIMIACADGFASNGQLSLTFHQSCETPTFDLLTLSDSTTHSRYYVWQPGLQRIPGGSFVIPDTWQPVPHSMTTIENTSPNASLGVELDAVIDGAAMRLDTGYNATPPAGTNTFSLMFAPTEGPFEVLVKLSQGIDIVEEHVAVTIGSPATTLDMAELPLPMASHVMQSATGVTWMESGAGAPDARAIVWGGSWVDGNTVEHDVSWVILESPEASGSSQLVPLPPDYARDDPTVMDPARTMHVQGASVFYVDYDNLDGYAAARAVGSEVIDVESEFLAVDHRAHMTVGTP